MTFRNVDTDERKRLADAGKALPDGSFPIATEEDLRNAIQAIGRAKDPEKAKSHIKKRAKALGKDDLIPETWSASPFLETVMREFDRMRARRFAGGYEGVTHAGLAIVALSTGRVLLAQRAYDETDADDVAETWEFPGGGLNPDEEPYAGALREFSEEVGWDLPTDAQVVNGWRSPEGNYQLFVVTVPGEGEYEVFEPTAEVQAVRWLDAAAVDTELAHGRLRPEMTEMDWSLIWGVSGNEDTMTELAVEPDLTMVDLAVDSIPVHGVLAPEEAATGDGRAFNDGSMTARPGRLPFSWQIESNPGHDKSVVVGSVDRLMRKDGLIHWEGRLMSSEVACDFAELLAFFGRFGVSVDGDNGSLDKAKSDATGITWFEAVRASGLTAVAIPAFQEAYVAFGPHPDMPANDDSVMTAALVASGDLVTFDRGPGWVTNPTETRRLHAYWTKKGEPGYAKIGWGTPGDFTRAKKLIGAKIAANSPEDMKYLNQIIARWHHDALGYWPGELGKPGNAPDTPENRKRAAIHAGGETREFDNPAIEATDDGWEAVLVSSVSGNAVRPPLSYFHRHEDMGAMVVEEPDANGFRRTYGYAGEWGVCHIGMAGRCVEPPMTGSDDYPRFHLGITRTDEGIINTGVLTYGVGHRDADTILRETAEQAYFDNVNNAWAAVRVGEDERGIWFAGVVLPGVPEDHIVKIEASGQVSGEWLYGQMSACLTVNVPGYAVERASASYDEDGNVIALAASAFNNIEDAPCAEPTPAERMQALARIDAEVRMDALREQFNWTDIAEELVTEAQEDGRVEPVGLREDGAVVYEMDGEIPGTDTIVEPYPSDGA